jgi:F-type H+-transporting ATPase subunit b
MLMFLAETPVKPNPNPLIPPLPELIIGAIAFLVVFAVLGRVLLPRIQKTLEERTDKIEGGLQRAENAQAEAARTLEQYRAQLNDARQEAARIRQEATEQGAQIIAEMRDQAQAEARRVTEAAQSQLAADRQQALAALRQEVGALAVDLAGKIVGESLADQATQGRLIDRFLDELDGQPAAAAGTAATAEPS